MAKPTNSYVLKYVPENLPWFERDDLMTWHDQGKCSDFLRDRNKHFREAKIVNFDIIHRACRGKAFLQNFLSIIRLLMKKKFLSILHINRLKFVRVLLELIEKTWILRKTIEKHYTKNKKSKVLLLRQSSF